MGNLKTMSANTVLDIAGVSGKQYKKVTWHRGEIMVRPFLQLKEFAILVNKIISDCINQETGALAYEFVDFSIRLNIIATYAFIELPKDIEQIYYVIYCSDLYETVCSAINKSQIDAIKHAVMMGINYTEVSATNE